MRTAPRTIYRNRHFFRNFLTVFCFFTLLNNSIWAGQPVPTTQKLDVDPVTGTAVTTIPVNVPQGRGGIQPSISLLYNSSSPNGPLGMGWSMDLGAVERSTKKGTPTYTNNDTFIFSQSGSSQELVDVSGNGTLFRPKVEGAFMKIELVNGTYWRVTDKKGTQYFFGQTAASRESDPNSSSKVFRWNLDYVVDVNGNYMTVSYVANGNKLYPSEIWYTGNTVNSISPYAKVRFDWNLNARPDILTSYTPGFKQTTAMRLRTIETYANSHYYTGYSFEYTADPETQLSLLTKATPIGSDGLSTLPPTLFSYSTNNLGFQTVKNFTYYSGQDMYVGNVRLMDMNKDGFIDLVDGSVADNYKIYFNNGNNDFNASTAGVNSPTEALNNPDVRLIDINGDNLMDIVSGTASGYQVWVNNGVNGFNAVKTITNKPAVALSSKLVQFMDMNGDGKVDLVESPSTAGGAYKIYFNTGSNDFGVGQTAVNSPNKNFTDTNLQLADFNGDGLMDVIYGNATSRYTVWINNRQNGFQAAKVVTNSPAVDVSSGKVAFVDMNNDGLADILYSSGNSAYWIYYNNGQNDFDVAVSAMANGMPPLDDGNLQLMDMNADGLADAVYGNGGNGLWRIYINNGINGFNFDSGATNGPNQGEGLTSGNMQLADINGDNRPDVFWGTAMNAPYKVYLSNADSRSERALVLVKIDNSMGGTTELQYDHVKLNCLLGQANRFVFNTLYFNTVKAITNKTAQGDSYTTTYLYRKCAFSIAEREFRGFGYVKVTDPDGNYTETNYAQDDVYKGRMLDQSAYDRNNALFSKTVNTWSSQSVATGVTFPFLQRVDNFVYDGTPSTGKHTAEDYTYDSYGNVTKVTQYGEVDIASNTDIGSDKRTVETTYGNNTSAGLLGFPQTVVVKDNSGTVVRQTWFYYDNASVSTTLPTKGLLTAKREWGGAQPGAVHPATYFTYDSFGNLKTTIDPGGHPTTIAYDSSFYVFPVTTTNAMTQSITNEYYGVNGVPFDSGDGFTGLFGQLKSTTDPNNQKGKSSYDVFGRTKFIVGPTDSVSYPTTLVSYQINPTYSKVTTQNRKVSGQAGTIDSYSFYDGLGRVIQTKQPSEVTGQYIVNGQTQYNSRGLPEKKYLPFYSTNPLDTIEAIDTSRPFTTIVYDAMGRAVQSINPDNTYSQVVYDDWTTTTIDENKHQQKSYFDAYGRLIKKEEYMGAVPSVTLYATTQYQYDSEGNLTKTIDAKGNTTTITYDTLGRKICMVDPDMGTWTYTYDASGNLQTQKDAKGQTITFTYDALNRLTNKTDGTTALNVNYTYDSTATSYSKGRITQASYSGGNTTFNYDPLGREIKSTKTVDTNSYSVERTYNALNNLTSLKYPDASSLTYTYNNAGQVQSVADSGSGGTAVYLATAYLQLKMNDAAASPSVIDDGSGANVISASTNTSNITSTGKIFQSFNLNGTDQYLNSNAFTQGVKNDTAGSYSFWVNRVAGQAGMVYGSGSSTGADSGLVIYFDANGSLEVEMQAYSGGPVFMWDYWYNNISTAGAWEHYVITQDGSTGLKVYKNGVLQTNPSISRNNSPTAWHKAVTNYSSTQLDTGCVGCGVVVGNRGYYFKGKIDDFRYYQFALSSTEISKLYNAGAGTEEKNPLVSGTPGSGATTYVTNVNYNAAGQMVRVQLGNGDVTTYTYDSKTLRLTNLTTVNKSNVTLQNLSYTYDAVGNILTITDSINTGTQTFTYDALNRLTQAVGTYNGTPKTLTFSYDQLGNLLTKDGLTYTYPAALAARPHAVSSLSDGTTFSYDANGNMASRAKSGVTTSYTYDTENRLTKVVKGATTQAQFAYDGDGGRVKKICNTTTTRYVGNLYEDTGSLKIRHIYLGSTEVASVNGTQVMFYHQDHLGSTNITTDSTGTKTEVMEYLPFGGFSRHDKYGSSSEVAWFYFTGKKLDDETGLYYYGARYYDPGLGRFITPDTIVQDPKNSQTLNRYTYCNNNPINNIDPTGHKFWKSFLRGFVDAIIRTVLSVVLSPLGPVGLVAAAALSSAATTAIFGGNSHEIWRSPGYGAAGFLESQLFGSPVMMIADGIQSYQQGGSKGLEDFFGGTLGSMTASTFTDSIVNQRSNSSGKDAQTLDGEVKVINERGSIFAKVQAVEHFVKDLTGKVWTLPNTALGLALGVAGAPFVLLSGQNPFIGISDNAINIRFPFTLGGGKYGVLTLGNVTLYAGTDMKNSPITPDSIIPSYSGEFMVRTGTHESSHTMDAQNYGPFYLPIYGIEELFTGGGGNHPQERRADNASRI